MSSIDDAIDVIRDSKNKFGIDKSGLYSFA